MADVFISYSSRESEVAREVREKLSARGYDIWMAPESIPAGESYAEAIPAAISSSRVLALLLTEHADASVWVQKEVGIALSCPVPVIPIRMNDHELSRAMSFYLADVQLRDAANANEAAEVIARALNRTPGSPSVRPSDTVSLYLKLCSDKAEDDEVFFPPSVLPGVSRRGAPLDRSLIASIGSTRSAAEIVSPELLMSSGGNVLVIGEAGSGKTTFLRQLFRRAAGIASSNPTAPFPLCVEAPTLNSMSLARHCIEALRRITSADANLSDLGPVLGERGIALFIDGLDECRSKAERKELLEALDTLRTNSAIRAMVITTRPAEDISPKGFAALRLAPLSKREQAEFLDRYIHRFGIESSGSQVLDSLPVQLRELATRPLFLALLVTSIAYRGAVPSDPDELFDDYLHVLLDGSDHERAPEVERVLCEVAFGCVRESRTTTSLTLIEEACKNVSENPEEAEILRAAVLESGIIAPFRNGARFVHLTFMDHLARNYAADLYSFRPSISMDQYFLRDSAKIELMVRSARVLPGDRVVELGAGIGSVARHIPKTRSLSLVELDEQLATILRNDFADRVEATVFCEDAIEWVSEHEFEVLFSNLPFFLTEDLLCQLADKRFRVAVMSVRQSDSLQEWEEKFRISEVEVIEGSDFFPPQPFASKVVRITLRT